MQETKIVKWFRNTGLAILLAGIAISLAPHQAKASDEIIFTYEGATQSVDLEELQTFADTGETSPALDFLLNFGKQNPLMIRWILNQEFPADTTLVYDLLNTAPGEYVLSQTSNIVGTRSERANIRALRGALVASASDDNIISLIELLDNYPTQKVYVNGKLLAKARKNLSQFIEETSRYIQIPVSFNLY
ncbi:MAG: alpha/beta hydrolase [Cyanobacteria bacterium P01_G01_bin.67]